MTQPRSLTEAEAHTRAQLLEVTRYDIELDLTGLPDDGPLRATSRVRFRCTDTSAETFVDCAAEVQQLSHNGRTLPAESVAAAVMAELVPAFQLRIGSSQPGRADRLHNSAYQPDEACIGLGVQALSRAAFDLLS